MAGGTGVFTRAPTRRHEPCPVGAGRGSSYHGPWARRGFGLLEAILVFAIVIGAGAIVFNAFRSAEAGAEASEAVDQIKLVVSNLRALDAQYRAAGSSDNVYVLASYNNLEGEVLREHVFQGMTPNGHGTLGWPAYQGVWGGSLLSILPIGSAHGVKRWELVYDSVEADSCPRFVMGVAPLTDTIAMSSPINVSGHTNSGTVKSDGGPLDTGLVNTLCSEFADNTSQYGNQYGGHVALIGH